VVLGATVVRAVAGAVVPLSGDEAYYWEWSRRLAAGYVDHPPAVAWLIALFSWAGRSPFAVRIGFVLCGLGSALFAGAAATALSGRRDAGAHAMLAVSLAPLLFVSFGMAQPDAPYLLAWSCALYCAAGAVRQRGLWWYAALGVALGAGLLSRFFGWALIAGIIAWLASSGYARRGGILACCTLTALVGLPFFIWNATHGWATFVFSLAGRHATVWRPDRPLLLFLLGFAAFSPALWWAALRALRPPAHPLLRWTGAPLSVLLFVLAVHERVEIDWFVGPFLSLAIAAACLTSQPSHGRYLVAGAMSALIALAVFAPGAVVSGLRAAGLHLRNGGPFELYTYPALARDLRGLAARDHAAIMTDGYGFSSLLDFYADIPPVVIGYDAQGLQSHGWVTRLTAPQALFVDKEPLATRPDFAHRLHLACGEVVPGPLLVYPLSGAGTPAGAVRRYYTTWCRNPKPSALAVLRWQT
jgi:4-amino-4-deoxy-L-arabinose transferase-like glycosyltransferase